MKKQKVFDAYSLYYNAFYEDKDYISEAETIKKLLERYSGKNIKSVIDLGCGTGKHDTLLHNSWKSVQIDGVDLSEGMIEKAIENAKGTNINYTVGDIRFFRNDKKYDVAMSLFHVMSYQNTNDDILNSFKTARTLLSENGLFLFDSWYGPGVLTDKPSVRVKKAFMDGKELVRIAKPTMHESENIVDVNYEVIIIDGNNKEIDRITEVHSMRYFFKPEIENYLNIAGFELLDCLDCRSLGQTSFDSWTAYFVARAV